MSGAKASPLEPLLSVQGVQGAVVFEGNGNIIYLYPESATISPWIDSLSNWFRRNSSLLHQVRELIVFYPRAMIFWKRLDKIGKPSERLGMEAPRAAEPGKEESSTVLVVIGDATSSASLVRLNLDVMEHSWRSQGIDEIFSPWSSKVSGGGLLGKIFRKKKAEGQR